MRIVFFTKLAPQLGTRRVYEVSARLARAGHHVTVVSAATQQDQPLEEVHDGFTVVALRTAPRLFRTPGRFGFFATRLPYYLLCARWLQQVEPAPDVVVEDVAPVASFRLARAATRRRIPLVYQIHSAYTTLDEWRTNYGPLGVLGYIWQRRIWRLATPEAVYSDAKWSTDRVASMGLRAEWIPNGVDLPPADRLVPKEANVRRLLTIGRLVRLKNQELLLRMMVALPDHMTLTVVGSGPLEARLRSLRDSLAVGDRVRFVGHVSHSQLLDHYRSSDLFLLPSFAEGQPLSVLEAMAMGLPVLMSDIPAAEGVVVPETGWLASPHDPAAWAECILGDAAPAESRIAKGQEARARVEKMFNWESTYADEVALLESVVREWAS